MYTSQQIQEGMQGEYPEWVERLREAGTRYTYSRTIQEVKIEKGKYIWLYYAPEHGKHQDKGKIDIGSVNSPGANFIAGLCQQYVGQRVRLLDSLVEGGGGQKYKRLTWVGELPADLEGFVVDDSEPDRPWAPPGQVGTMPAQPAPQQQQYAHQPAPQPAQMPAQQPVQQPPAQPAAMPPAQPAMPQQMPPAQPAPMPPAQPGQFGYPAQ